MVPVDVSLVAEFDHDTVSTDGRGFIRMKEKVSHLNSRLPSTGLP